MERPASRVPAPSTRSTAPPTKRNSGESTSSLQPPNFGFRRPHTAANGVSNDRRRSSREGFAPASSSPRLALHELHHGVAPPPPSTANYLKRGSGRTIATLGPPVASPPPSRRKSASSPPPRATPTPTPKDRSSSMTPQRTKQSVRNPVELFVGNKMETKRDDLTSRQDQHDRGYHPQQTPLSPETYFRQRKRSADMMDPLDPSCQSPVKIHHDSTDAEEVDEPPMPHTNEIVGPMTPPPRTSGAHENGALMPLSPPDSKRQKHLTRSPKTPLGTSNYETEEGRMSATQRVRLSLSGFMTVANLTGPRNARRESGAGALSPSMLVSNGSVETPGTSEALVTTKPAPRSSPTKLSQSSSSLARSRFAASRSMSGPALASALVPTKNSIDCLMGYMRELQRSEAMLRVKLEQTRKQGHEELSRSTVHARSLESTINLIKSERERERRQLEEQARMIDALKAEVAELHFAMNNQLAYDNGTGKDTSSNQTVNPGGFVQQQDQFQDQSGQWTETNGSHPGMNGYAEESSNGYPATSYVTPPPSRSHGQPYERTTQQSQTDTSGPSGDESMTAAQPAEWTNDQTGYYQTGDYGQYQNGSAMPPGVEGYPGDQAMNYNGPDSYQYYQQGPGMVQDNTQSNDWAQPNGDFAQQEYYENHTGGVLGDYAAMPAVPMSPVAKLDPSKSPKDVTAVQPQVDAPPPMFRVAPRLSDIISPLSRSIVAAPVTTDHNVLKPVTLSPPPMTNTKTSSSKDVTADQAFMLAPPSVGPPAFNMSGFRPSSEHGSTPLSSKPKRHGGTVSKISAEPIPDHPVEQEEQFVPAEQVFRPFHKPKTPTRKASVPGPKPLSKETLKELLVEFFTAVDKTKLRMVEGYSRRYQGQETKLLTELTKKYGEQKLAELKNKIENATKPLTPVDASAQICEPTTQPPLSAPSPVYTHAPDDNSGSGESTPLWDQPSTGDHGIVSAVTAEITVGEVATSNANSVQDDHGPPLLPSDSAPVPTASLSSKVSPNSVRRGPQLPFAFENEEPGPELLPPPVLVTAPPPGMAPSLPPQSPTGAPSSPPRLAPSPPQMPPPPPGERSPARNASVLRQRVSPQRILPRQSRMTPPMGPPPMQPLPTSGTPSPPKPVTLEGLLLEFYRKQQPDRLKHVPEVVKQYTGNERELISLLKKKYGALSIKRLEQNLEVLEQQSAATAAKKPPVATAPTKSQSNATKEPKKKSRGCITRLVLLVWKVIFIRIVVMFMLFGGLVAVDHNQCMQDPISQANHGSVECQSLLQDIESFQMSSFTSYAQQMESRECFCDQWRLREARLLDQPSVTNAIDLAKLVPFSRTIAEPAWLQLVDRYFPNLPYGEYYRSYVKPAFLTGKDYAVSGAKHAKEAYVTVVANMPEMPWHEYYESQVKPLVGKGLEHYDSHGKRVIEWTGEYAYMALEHTRHAWKELCTLATDQWVLLVEMYNEEGRVSSPSTEKAAPGTSSFDVLTKAAKASKALAESTEAKNADTSAATVDETISAHETNDATDADGGAAVDPVYSVEAPVEVFIDQSGLDLSYASTETTSDIVGTDVLSEDTSNAVDEVAEIETIETLVIATSIDETVAEQESIDDVINESIVVEETIYVSEAEPVEEPVDTVQETGDATEISHVDQDRVGNDFGVIHDGVDTTAKQDTADEVINESVVEDEVAQASEGEKIDDRVDEEDEPSVMTETSATVDRDYGSGDDLVHDVAEVPTVVEDEMGTIDFPVQPEQNFDAEELPSVQEVELSEPMPVVQYGDAAEVHLPSSEPNDVDAVMGHDEETITATAEEVDYTPTELPAIGDVDVDAENPASRDSDEVGDAIRAVDVDDAKENADSVLSTYSDVKQDDSETKQPTSTEATDEPEDLSFLDEGEGFDPLELLDMADLAAVELHTQE